MTLKFVRKDTNYNAYRELLKSGNKIIGWIEQRPNGKYYYAFGKPSQTSFISFECDTLSIAKNEMLNVNFY